MRRISIIDKKKGIVNSNIRRAHKGIRRIDLLPIMLHNILKLKHSAAYNSIFDDDPEAYDAMRDSWLYRRREDFIRRAVAGMGLSPGSTVLEVGSGAGALLYRLAGDMAELDFVGIEPLEKYVEYSRRKYQSGNLRFIKGASEEVSGLVGGPVSLVLSNDVMHHVRSIRSSIEEISKITEPGARWLLIEPNVYNLYVFLNHILRPDERNFYPGSFVRTAAKYGWVLEKKSYLFLVPSFLKDAPAWLKKAEAGLEHIPFLGGGVAIELRKT